MIPLQRKELTKKVGCILCTMCVATYFGGLGDGAVDDPD